MKGVYDDGNNRYHNFTPTSYAHPDSYNHLLRIVGWSARPGG